MTDRFHLFLLASLPLTVLATGLHRACAVPPAGEPSVAAAAMDRAPRTRLAVEHLRADRENPERVRVTLGGELFAEYRVDAGHQPVVWPIFGPGGVAMTRPLTAEGGMKPQRLPGSTDDHPHHQSLWFTHGGVNGIDFWNVSPAADPAHKPRVIHTGFTRREVVGGEAIVATTNDWVHGGELVLQDSRTLAFGETEGAGAPRYIDFTIELIAPKGEVVFADTKEGSFGVRVPDAMRVEARRGGQIVNSRGQVDDAAWGQPAEWVDYHGPLSLDDASPGQGGIALLAHPAGLRSPCRWHVRGYGLFAANPFGERDFPAAATDGEGEQGSYTLAPGERATLRYRAVFYSGTAPPERIAEWYNQYAATSLTSAADAAPVAVP